MVKHGMSGFNGFSLLLLSPKKLDLLREVFGGNKQDSMQLLMQIREACSPLRMPYAPQSPLSASTSCSVDLKDDLAGDLYPVERHKEHALLLRTLMEREASCADAFKAHSPDPGLQ